MKPLPKSPARLILSFLFPYKKLLVLLVVLWLFATTLGAIQPLVMAPMLQVALNQTNIFSSESAQETLGLSEVNLNNMDQFVSQVLHLEQMQPWDIVLLLSLLFFGIVLTGALLETLAFYIYTRVRVQTLRKMQEYAFGHLLSLSLDFFNKQRSGGIVSRLQADIAASVNQLTGILKSATTAPIMILIYGTMLVRTNFELMLLVSLIAAAQWFGARLLRSRIRKFVVAEFDLIAMATAYLNEIFQNIRVVKSFVAERFEQARLRAKFEQMIPVHINFALTKHWQEPMVVIINGLGNVLILLLSARELFSGNLTVVGFLLFLYVGRAMIQPISQIGQIYLGLQEMAASADRVYEIVRLQPTITAAGEPLDNFRDSIEFKSVSFNYGDDAVLDGVGIEIERGKTVALVGPSGAGKSTFTDLLLRFYDPTGGEVFIDGKNIRRLQIDSYRRLFGVVGQENLLFNETIANNIAYGRDGLSREQIIAAAQIANAAEFIETMPLGYETLVGDRGIRLSGGQRQRIAIARAVVHQPEILILDEATSSLDTEAERLVQTAIDKVVLGRTAVVIAHRLSTVIHADKIVVLENGRVLDQGRHQELFERCDLYRRLCQLQFRTDFPDDLVAAQNLERVVE